jgi:hypothetical protein
MGHSSWNPGKIARLKLRLPHDILLQNPFNFGNGFWMGHQVVTGWNYLL